MEGKPLLLPKEIRPVPVKRALHLISGFLHDHEAAANEISSSYLLNRDKVAILGDDVLEKLNTIKSFMETTQSASKSPAKSSSSRSSSGDAAGESTKKSKKKKDKDVVAAETKTGKEAENPSDKKQRKKDKDVIAAETKEEEIPTGKKKRSKDTLSGSSVIETATLPPSTVEEPRTDKKGKKKRKKEE